MMKPFIVVQGPVATRSGYGDHTRDLVHSLIAMDKYDIKIIRLDANISYNFVTGINHQNFELT